MKKLFLALLATATALAIAPAAMAVPITLGSFFQVGGNVTNPPATTPTPALDSVIAYAGHGTFASISPAISLALQVAAPPPLNANSYYLSNAIVGDTFNVQTTVGTDTQDVVFTVTTYSTVGCTSPAFVCGYGTITDTGSGAGSTTYDPGLAAWSANLTIVGGSTTETEGFVFTDIATTPEPSSLLLLGTGLLGLAFFAFRKAKSSSMALSM